MTISRPSHTQARRQQSSGRSGWADFDFMKMPSAADKAVADMASTTASEQSQVGMKRKGDDTSSAGGKRHKSTLTCCKTGSCLVAGWHAHVLNLSGTYKTKEMKGNGKKRKSKCDGQGCNTTVTEIGRAKSTGYECLECSAFYCRSCAAILARAHRTAWDENIATEKNACTPTQKNQREKTAFRKNKKRRIRELMLRIDEF